MRAHDTGPSRGPGRQALAIAAAALTALAIYGSLVPLQFVPIGLDQALSKFREIPYLTIGPSHRADWVANILLFVPLGFLWLGSFVVDAKGGARRIFAAALVVVAGTSLSVTLEFTQLWFPRRTVSQNDIIAETLGTAIGVLLWFLAGQGVVEWLRALARSRRPSDRRDRLLALYTVGLIAYSVLPLDLTISSGDLASKLREGRLILIPFSDVRLSFTGIYEVLRDIVVFVPVGMLLAVWRTRIGSRVRPVAATAALGFVAAAGLELAQVFVLSRFSSTTDCFLGCFGAAIGGAVLTRAEAGTQVTSTGHNRIPAWLKWAFAAAGYAALLVVIFCGPFAVSGTHAEWRERYEAFWALPFSRLYTGSEFNAVSDVLRKLILFGVLGSLLERSFLRATPRGVRVLMWLVCVLVGMGLAFSIELLQVVMPPHVPDVTDVFLGAAGTALGLTVMGFASGSRRQRY